MSDTPQPDVTAAATTRVGSTYRVQIRPGFDLGTTAGLADYLADLGVTHLYSAPLLAATPGSAHGYDVVDHRAVNPELGGEAGRQRLVRALRAAGLGLVVDIVPNHAGVAQPAANPAWWDVLRRGRDSAYADWFDIDWDRGRLLLPVLADSPDALEDLKVVEGELRYHEHRFPIADGTGAGSPREVHDRQHYELISWRRGDAELTYRRFFAVSDLAGLRVEDPAVFAATHAEILRWADAGELDGVRVDHPDGLRDPAGYLARLRAAAPAAWLVVEKILEYGEELPAWPVDGTTGYDALAAVSGLFVDPDTEGDFTALDARLTGHHTSWQDLTHDTKLAAATRLLAAELSRLAALVPDLDQQDARAALAELAACFPVYRGYPPEGARHLAAARSEAGRRRPDLTATLDAVTARLRDPRHELAARFPQLTGAVMAKGVEDTAYYRWSRFVALNEVGGSPAHFGVPPAEFHRFAAARQVRWPASMTTLSTHDTKRGEDVRARLAVLSELPGRWAEQVTDWMSRAPLADRAFAHLLWQTAVGAWPIERDRLHAYVEKAAREASLSTSWADPDLAFERQLHALVDRMYDDPGLHAEITAFAAGITPAGWSNSLAQKLVQLAMPGVPDTYQGTELWENSLVDPDNRRPVDFAVRRDLLARLDGGWRPEVAADGAAKLLVVSRTLRLRRDRPELFAGYRPVPARGPAARHALAFDRGGAIAVATRLPLRLNRAGGWRDTTLSLPVHSVADMFTGRVYSGSELLMHDLLSTYPVALLAPTDSVEAAA
ncbi:malto-oligosyltrehalose synthase [Micromonospora sp. 4G57]|uniref:Malto-oligosyltrehalose synthase n=1 Tax=Micromonospora sicca TaxID=2202420 RepID=A0ABU5JHD2_9ACTN|nr:MULTISPECIES: malto-oligosyltrehalose synthase [unclassified Micromonospora]MDZ5446125.1 malto-oligosyltrehalose synthase [Micromonospora sp. 4G57]MDZ5491991.1 malto-oligosyltrehalose synthase [Micromonospora sp. 4G53]